jgi:hypothetical protein
MTLCHHTAPGNSAGGFESLGCGHPQVGPELEIPGYGCEDHFLELDTIEHSWECLAVHTLLRSVSPFGHEVPHMLNALPEMHAMMRSLIYDRSC